MLALWLCETVDRDRLFDVDLKTGPLPFHRTLSPAELEQLRDAALPLPSARLHLEPGAELDLVEAVVRAHGLELRELRVKHPRDSFFSKGSRAALVLPATVSESAAEDELYPGRKRLTLGFDLPRGSYATVLVKRITEC
jgi:tRNA pseudouridine13 synthase